MSKVNWEMKNLNIAGRRKRKTYQTFNSWMSLISYFSNNQGKLHQVNSYSSLNGQQFRIYGCKDCNIYVHDNHDQCFIDDVMNSVVVMGPCASSTFIRTSKNCKMVITCQQLRLRDCFDLEIMLFSQTQVGYYWFIISAGDWEQQQYHIHMSSGNISVQYLCSTHMMNYRVRWRQPS